MAAALSNSFSCAGLSKSICMDPGMTEGSEGNVFKLGLMPHLRSHAGRVQIHTWVMRWGQQRTSAAAAAGLALLAHDEGAERDQEGQRGHDQEARARGQPVHHQPHHPRAHNLAHRLPGSSQASASPDSHHCTL